MDKVFCIYHGNCQDGFGAAWAVRHALGDDNVEFFEGHYNRPSPDVAGRNVVMVDFSYKRPVLEEMAKQANSILILDHHKSAKEDLAGLFEAPPFSEWQGGAWCPRGGEVGGATRICVASLFDMERSGTGIAWDYFHPNQFRPMLLNHIQDRDLWHFKLMGTREISAGLFSYPYDFEVWDNLIDEGSVAIETLAYEGTGIERKHNKDIAELLAVTQRSMLIAGFTVPVASLPYTMASDAGNRMALGQPFAATYYDTATHRVFSLRSLPGGADVSKIAVSFGGGGHERASGFSVPRDHELAKG